jgi:hypothetical protein
MAKQGAGRKILPNALWRNSVSEVCLLRIPAQSCHPFQTNAATHSILKLPLIPVNVATLWW